MLIRRQGGHRESHRGPRLMHIHDGSRQGSGWIKNFMYHIKRSFPHDLKPFHEGSRYGSRWIKINRLAENVAAYGFQSISVMGPIMDHDGSRRNGCQDNRRFAFRSMHSVVEYRCCPREPGHFGVSEFLESWGTPICHWLTGLGARSTPQLTRSVIVCIVNQILT